MTRIAQAIVADLHLAPDLVPRVATTILSNYECRYKKEQRHRAAQRLELRALMKFFAVVSETAGTRLTMPFHLHRITAVREMLSLLYDWKKMPAKIRIVDLGGDCYEVWRV